MFSGEVSWHEYLASLPSIQPLPSASSDASPPTLKKRKRSSHSHPLTTYRLSLYRHLAVELIEKDRAKYLKALSSSRGNKDSEYSNALVEKLIRNGTLKDKVNGLSLKVAHCSLHNLESVDVLLSLLKSKNQRQINLTVTALKELFLKNLLPKNQKLRWLKERPLTSLQVSVDQKTKMNGTNDGRQKRKKRKSSLQVNTNDVEHSEKLLMLWYFEDEIKQRYLRFINSLQSFAVGSHDLNKSAEGIQQGKSMQAGQVGQLMKKETLGVVLELLENHPEQEQFILMILVNKLVDSNQKISSLVVILLKKLLEKHFDMRKEVVLEVRRFIQQQLVFLSKLQKPLAKQKRGRGKGRRKPFQNGNGEPTAVVDSKAFKVIRGIYLAATFLSQVIFERDVVDTENHDIAFIIISICVDLLNRVFDRASLFNVDSQIKLIGILLCCLNRSFPYLNQNSLFSNATEAKEEEAEDEEEDEAKEVSISQSLEDLVDVLFKVSHSSSFSAAISALSLLLKIMNAKQGTSDRYYRAVYTKMQDVNAFFSADRKAAPTALLNLVFNALSIDTNETRIVAFLKRLLQLCLTAPFNFCCGVIILVSQLVKERPFLLQYLRKEDDLDDLQLHRATNRRLRVARNNGQADLTTIEAAAAAAAEESVVSSSAESSDEELEQSGLQLNITVKKPKVKDAEEEPQAVLEEEQSPAAETEYDPMKRDPGYCGISGPTTDSLIWEFSLLLDHYHPLVRDLAEEVASDALFQPGQRFLNGFHPLHEDTLMTLLDRLSFHLHSKTGKGSKSATEEASSTAQNHSSKSVFSSQNRRRGIDRATPGSSLSADVLMNSSAFLKQDFSTMYTSEQFCYKYFYNKLLLEGSSFSDLDKEVRTTKTRNKRAGEDYDSEASDDAFAEKLARQLLKQSADGVQPDVDEDFELDMEEDGEEDSFGGNSVLDEVESIGSLDEAATFAPVEHIDAVIQAMTVPESQD